MLTAISMSTKVVLGRTSAIRIHDKSLYKKLFLHPELVAGEAYMDERLTIEKGTLRDFLTLFFVNSKHIRSHPVQKMLNTALKRVKKLHQNNTREESRGPTCSTTTISPTSFTGLFLDTRHELLLCLL